MKRAIYGISVLAVAIFSAVSAFADIKVKSKQTMSGQSYESTTYIKGKRQRNETFGGMVNITQCDLKRNIQINQNSQTYLVTPFTTTETVTKPGETTTDKNGVVQTGGRVTTTITTKDTGERKQMFGYTARHLIITMETVSSPDACNKMNSKIQTDGWYIDAAFALDCDYGMSGYAAAYNKKGGCQDKYDMKTVGTAKRGFAVYEKMTMFDGSGKETMTMVNEVVELSQATLDASLFDTPAGFREVSDASQMYAAAATSRTSSYGSTSGATSNADSGMTASVNAAKTAKVGAQPLGPKKAGVIRIGVAGVKTGAVGEGIPAADLAQAIQNSLMQNLKMPNVEVVALDGKSEDALTSEARSKDCDFVAELTASHKKGGGGFGMFKSLAPVLGGIAPAAGNTGTGGYIAGQTAVSAATLSRQIKNKDEITLDVKLNKTGGASVLERSVKAKAKSNGEDIITQAVVPAAQAIIASAGVR